MKKNLFKLFLCLMAFFACAPNAWGQFYKVRLQAVYDYGASGGKLFACEYEDTHRGSYESDPSSITGWTTDEFEAVFERDSYGLDIVCWAETSSGSPYFVSWYTDAECTEDVSFNNKKYNPYSTKYAHYPTREQAAAAEPVATFYAKFTTYPKQKFYAECIYKTDPNKYGGISYLTASETVSLTNQTKTENREAYAPSATMSFYVKAYPVRGYGFKQWILTGDNISLYDEADLTKDFATIHITSSSTNSAAPESGTVEAEYVALSANSLTIEKVKNRGTVNVSYTNMEAVSETSITTNTVSLSSMTASETSKTYDEIYSTDVITMEAFNEEGYEFKGWYLNEGGVKSWYSSANPLSLEPGEGVNKTFYAYFSRPLTENDKFTVGESVCQTFEQAIAAATLSATDKTILQIRNYTIPAGNYTIPAGVTLVVPYNAEQGGATPSITRVGNDLVPSTAYCTLTLETGVNINVYGAIEVSGCQTAGALNAKGEVGVGRPGAPSYGLMIMEEGSRITLNNGANFRAWGFVQGQGEIDARRGSVVREQFQVMDWKNATNTRLMFDDHKVLPINQYYIQNIEVPTVYHPGAKLYGISAVNVQTTVPNFTGIISMNDAGIIGTKYGAGSGKTSDLAVFLLDDEDDSEDTWVRKYYDVEKDQQVYEVNNSAHLGSLVMKMKVAIFSLDMDSREYVLPITNSFKIHLLSGNLDVTQDTELLPGAEIEVNKKSTLTICPGQTLYLYDANQWGNYVYQKYRYGNKFVYGSRVKFRPGGVSTARDISTKTGQGNAKLTVHGTVDVQGYLMTTEGGASIISTKEDAGTVIFSNAAPAFSTDHFVEQITNGTIPNYVKIQCVSAKLTDEDGNKSPTAETPSNKSFCYVDMDNDGDGEWICLTAVYDPISQCYPLVKDQYENYYAKPQDYVKLLSKDEDENTHLYYSEDGSRMFILIPAECQWWEVEAVPNHPELFHCTHPLNNTYYYWDDAWVEKLFRITFKNWDGTILTYGDDDKDYYDLPYGATPQWLSANPTRPADEGYYTYDFAGWKPTPAPITDDAVYTAQYDRTPVMYAITFEEADHTLIEITYSQRDSMPVCLHYTLGENEKWIPVLAPVTGNATYTLATKTSQSDYTIIWKNWDGTPLETDLNVTGMPEYNGATPTKPILGDTKYTFAGWYPEVQTATEDKVYVALFDEADNDIEVGGTPVTINKDSVVSTVTIHNNGVLTIDNNKKLTVTNLILEADVDPVTPANEASGQLYAANSTQVTVDYAYYDLKLNVAGHHWRAFGVPWQVNIDATPLKEVKTQAGDPSDRTLVLGRDYDIVYYNGAKRASSGAGYWCWEFVENHEHVLQPGQGYMIQFVAPVGTVRFAKAIGAPVIFTGTVDLDENASAIDVNNGWNAMSNPMPFHATMTNGPTVGYVHDGGEIGSDGYVKYNLAGKFIVGKTVYVQAGAGGDDVSPVYASSGSEISPASPAPMRRTSATDKKYMALEDYYTVVISDAAGNKGGDICVLPEEGKENKYVIGHDLAQFGMSAAIPQVWVNRYDTKLALNTTALFNETAEFPMGVYAPNAGEYTISLNAQPSDEYNVYLTRDGQAIWNLSDGAFTADLKAGIQSNYGLRLTVNKAPQVVTGIDEAIVDANGETKKVLINNQVFIIRGEQVYTIDGQIVK